MSGCAVVVLFAFLVGLGAFGFLVALGGLGFFVGLGGLGFLVGLGPFCFLALASFSAAFFALALETRIKEEVCLTKLTPLKF